MDALTTTLEFVVEKLPYFAAGIVLVFLGKLFYNLTTKYDIDRHLTAERNSAVGISFGGYLVGLAFAISATLIGTTSDLLGELAGIVITGALSILLLRLSMIINDHFVLFTFKVGTEIAEEQNVGTGYVVGGMSIATGLMLSGVMSGTSSSLLFLLRDVVIYWAAGQVILIIDGLVFQAITRYDVHKSIEDDANPAVGISFGSFLIAQGLITRTALTGAGSDLGRELLITAVIAASGLILLLIGRVIADKVFLPHGVLSQEVAEHKNTAAAVIAAATFLVIAILYSSAANPSVASGASAVLTGAAQ
jgi:uncharacterized membrane protein YjfL (UPF0719 family)